MIENDMPFAACDGAGQIFMQMYPEPVAADFTCSADKAKYVVRFGLAPYFKSALSKDIITSGYGYTLHYDETTTVQVRSS